MGTRGAQTYVGHRVSVPVWPPSSASLGPALTVTIVEFPGKYPVLRAYSSDVGAASGGEPPLLELGP